MKKKIGIILAVSLVLGVAVFLMENVFEDTSILVTRNAPGEGKKEEVYEVTVENELEDSPIEVEIKEQEYAPHEIEGMFQEVMKELDKVILGENESFDRVEQDLRLVSTLSGYGVDIQWELDSYEVLRLDGKIQKEDIPKEGVLVELRGTIAYKEEKAVYVRNVRVCPPIREGTEKLLYEIRQALIQKEEATRQEASFTLPKEVSGKKLIWGQRQEQHWYYVPLIGITLAVFLVYREKERGRQEQKRRKEEMLQAYPGMISKFTMLLGTGTTVKGAWEKIIHNYEEQETKNPVYEEMKTALHEMQSGVSESEAYERFGKRCNITALIKFGALLSQNLRKGSKGLADMLRMEAMQSFENRKSRARQKGEEAGTKLLMPMMGMLAVVLIMVMIPAFLTMQL